MRNYIRLGGWIYAHYMYLDLNVNEDYVADSLFYKRHIPVKFKNEMWNPDEKYRAIFCKVRRKYIDSFEEALNEIKDKMSLLGHNDYEEYCQNLFKKMGIADALSD